VRRAYFAAVVALAIGVSGARAQAAVVTVGAPQHARPIAPGFLGLSLEYSAVEPYAGTDPAALDPAFVQLVRNLNPGQQPVLRIGGDSTDWAWWPTPSVRRPLGIRIDLSPTWLAVTRSLADTLNAKLILGINLEADSRALAAAEARAFASGLGRSHVQSLELGNEPELYHSFGWYTNARGRTVPGRGDRWSFANYVKDYSKIAAGLPPIPLAGPAIGAPGWLPNLGAFAKAQRRVKTVTVHRYPLQRCHLPAASSRFPTIAHLLAPAASAGLADSVIPLARAAHAHGDPIRVDEMNTVSCGGAAGVSNAFASALWTVDALFGMARVGVDGVNIHTYRGATYELFSFQHVGDAWSASVRPQYYGMLLFAQATPPGSHLLHVAGASGQLRAWATRAPDGRTRIVLINEDGRRAHNIALRVQGAHGAGSLERLLAPGLRATSGVTLGGQSFGTATSSGQLTGAPNTTTVTPRGNSYAVSLPPASAAMLTLR
jgi:hypothetical protein